MRGFKNKVTCEKCKEYQKEIKSLKAKLKRRKERDIKFKISYGTAVQNFATNLRNLLVYGEMQPFEARRWKRNKATSPTIRQVVNRGW